MGRQPTQMHKGPPEGTGQALLATVAYRRKPTWDHRFPDSRQDRRSSPVSGGRADSEENGGTSRARQAVSGWADGECR